MWTVEEFLNGSRLSDIINSKHENPKYLPGITLPSNVFSEPFLHKAVQDATLLVFVFPHQFVSSVCEQLKTAKLSPRVRGISLIKGLDTSSPLGISLISDSLSEKLNMDISVLMGANIAHEVAQEQFCETTIGLCNLKDQTLYKKLFYTPYFRVSLVQDVAGVEICGALKNVVAIAAGLVDGLKLGENTKAAIIRIGLMEMKQFAKLFFTGVKDETFFESCGIADVVFLFFFKIIL
jgi:glycerol-3-phosphate dehydrogenase (NAD+)